MPDDQFESARIAALYDEQCADRADTDFYVALADRLDVRRVLDVGCGTGVLAVDLAAAGHAVTGVDPAGAMLDIARHRPGGDRVTWVRGEVADVEPGTADLAVMNGHVAQVFTDHASWHRVLTGIHVALAPAGRLTFELRHPLARAWECWTPARSRVELDAADGPVSAYAEVTEVAGDLVTFVWTYEFATETLRSSSTLRFPDRPTTERSLAAAGFEVEHVWGDWDGSDCTDHSPEMIFLTRRLATRDG